VFVKIADYFTFNVFAALLIYWTAHSRRAQRRAKAEVGCPDDGCSWIQTGQGVQAQLVLQDGPADRAGIQPGDTLLAINGHPVQTDRQVTEILYDVGPWNPATYTINRAGSEFKSTMIVAGPSLHLKRQRLFLEIIGLFYFLVGILSSSADIGLPRPFTSISSVWLHLSSLFIASPES